MKTHFYAFAIALLLLLCLNQAVYARHVQPPAEHGDPAQSLQTTLDSILAFNSEHRDEDIQAVQHFVEHEIMPHFAFQTMAHWIAGPFARDMTLRNESDFVCQLKTDFSAMLVQHLGSIDPASTRIEINRTRFTRSDEAIVAVQASLHQRRQLSLSFRMQWLDNQWRVVDIRTNGTSLVLYYRARYIDQLRAYHH